MNEASKALIKGILSGDRQPMNRAERRVWDRFIKADARRGRRAHRREEIRKAEGRKRIERALASYPEAVAA